ncbi:alpha/beta-hydrolase [Gonapodya prolifera JEL478]|uniref:Alpha/beta-hydrolase n=1 Tax=Gonapodya prolifera (strain JEL478) TaxID=1344416 RepID=A0A139AS06_GONPJ|nr:alpha/beta-hydrolase [Gonapodya prolifera JEL478]|eukprot:KXS19520.1 alpha/beta-hydrolase [Gonapodya prolifera JEL478]
MFLRTPDSRFERVLAHFPYEPRFIDIGQLRMAFIDVAGPAFDKVTGEPADPSLATQEVFLCVHGQPTWSYLYRRMIPIFIESKGRPHMSSPGFPEPSPRVVQRRVIAPDLFGFGRSDKPTQESDYTFNFHRDSLIHLITHLNLTNITLVCQDWGGILGLTLPHALPDRFSRLIVMNTDIPDGSPAGTGFSEWLRYSNSQHDMAIGRLIGRGASHVSHEELDGYDTPYPDATYKAGVRAFPNLVPIRHDMEGVDHGKAAREFLRKSVMPTFICIGMKDPVLGPPVMDTLVRSVFSANPNVAVMRHPPAGHFVQEWGEVVAARALDVFQVMEGGVAWGAKI